MPVDPISPGDDVEAWCTRCRMNLNHRIIAVVRNQIQRVHCLTCGGDHKYYPPKYPSESSEKSSRAPLVSRTAAGRLAARQPAEKSSTKALREWERFMQEMPEGTVPLPYSASGKYSADDFIEHPVFGTGRIIDLVAAEKMQVIFKDGRKVLICNRSKVE
jgi:hypothetical protein